MSCDALTAKQLYNGASPFPCQAFRRNLHMFEALERAFRFNFTCSGPRNANGTNSGAPERRFGAIRLTLTTLRTEESIMDCDRTGWPTSSCSPSYAVADSCLTDDSVALFGGKVRAKDALKCTTTASGEPCVTVSSMMQQKESYATPLDSGTLKTRATLASMASRKE